MINFKVSPVSSKIAIGEVRMEDILVGGLSHEIPEGWRLHLIVGPFDQADRWMRVLMASREGRYFHAGECCFCRRCESYWPVVYYEDKRWCPMCGTEN